MIDDLQPMFNTHLNVPLAYSFYYYLYSPLSQSYQLNAKDPSQSTDDMNTAVSTSARSVPALTPTDILGDDYVRFRIAHMSDGEVPFVLLLLEVSKAPLVHSHEDDFVVKGAAWVRISAEFRQQMDVEAGAVSILFAIL